MNSHIEELRETIEDDYHCRAKHLGSASVIERRGRETIWQGNVEVFEVASQFPARRCYAWQDPMGSRITILGLGPIHSPAAAVHAALLSNRSLRARPREISDRRRDRRKKYAFDCPIFGPNSR